MNDRPDPTWVYHITRIEHLTTMVQQGLWSDTEASARGLTMISIAYDHIKERRARRTVDVGALGTLADYAPFYFAPRSPMLYAIARGRISKEAADCHRIVYLVSTVQNLRGSGRIVVTSDRHAASPLARFTSDDQELTDSVDWPLMNERYWDDVAEYPDRCARRQAELLVHRHVPWDSILWVATKSEATASEVRALLTAEGATTRVTVRPGWYF